MTKSSRAVTSHLPLRPGEGFEVAVDKRQIVTVNGESAINIGINLSEAPAPDRRYVADVWSIVPTVGGYKLLFGQERIGTSELRSLIVIHMSGDAIFRLVEAGAAALPTGVTIASDEEDGPVVVSKEPEQTVALKANVVYAAFANGDACFDFYHMSPFGSHNVQNGGRLQLSAVVRVELRTGQYLAIFAEFQRLLSGANPTTEAAQS